MTSRLLQAMEAADGNQEGRRSGSGTDERTSTHAERQMTCPECGENAQHRPPSDQVSWEAHGLARPGWSHRDGSSLCPVIGPSGGYQPAQPQPAEPGAGAARPEPPVPAGEPGNRDPASRFGPLYDSEGQLIEGPIEPAGSILTAQPGNPAPEPGASAMALARSKAAIGRDFLQAAIARLGALQPEAGPAEREAGQ